MHRSLAGAALPPVAALVAATLLVAGCSGASTAATDSTTATSSVEPSTTSSAGSPPASAVSTGAASGSAAPTSDASTSSAPAGTGAAQSPVSVENNPPGDISDNIAFVAYTSPANRYSFTHPEGWLQQGQGAGVLFTDKLNGVQVAPGPATSPPTVASARADMVPTLIRDQAAFELHSVAPASAPGGTGVLIVYRRNSAPDQVTGRQYRDEVQRYELVAHGHEVVVELFGPVGADNVDAYRTMITSLKIA